MKSSTQIFAELYSSSSRALNYIRQQSIQPEKRKLLRDFGITEAAELIGRTPQTLRNLEESGKIPPPRVVENGKRKDRVYSLKEINQIREIIQTRPSKPTDKSAAIIAFVNFKGGVGKSTSSVHSAQYFAQKGYKVLFIDLDSQASSTHTFGYIPDQDLTEKDTLLDILINEEQDIRKVIKETYWDGLKIIPANLSLYNAELILPTQIVEYARKHSKNLDFYNRLNKAIEKISNEFDIIILDLPPSMGMISINAIYAANGLVITVPPESLDFSSTNQFCKQCQEVLERLPPKHYDFIKFLITKYDGQANAQEMKMLFHQIWNSYMLNNYMVESQAIAKATADVKTLYEVDPSKSPGAKKTYERALHYINLVNEEIEALLHVTWNDSTANIAKKIIAEDA